MSRYTSSGQPDTDKATTEEGLPPDDTAEDQDASAEDGTATDTPDGTADGTEGDAGADDPDGTGTATAANTTTLTATAASRGWRDRYPAVARIAPQVITVLAAVLVLFALLLPNQLSRLTPGAFLRIPVEAIFATALLLLLPPKARRVVSMIVGVSLGLLTILKFVDMGFYSLLDRPFDLVLDWILFGDAESFLEDSVGQAGTIGTVIGVAVIILGLLTLMPLAVLRLNRLMARHSAVTTRTTLVVGIAWMTFAALGLQIAGVPVSSKTTAALVHNRAHQVRAGLKDEQTFANKAAVDDYRDTPGNKMLTGLRGKDVMLTFIESYGRSAVEDPRMAPQVDKVLDQGTKQLRSAGFSSRSGWLTSPVSGAGSWLAHSTFLSGLWINNQQRYRNLTSSNRLTLTSAFKRTKAWRTVGMMPGVTRSWPEGKFFGLDHIHDSREIGYKGPKFSWSPAPDQYSLTAFQRLEHRNPGPKPLMSEIILTSSHNPWSPIPKMIPWNKVGDGSVYKGIKKAGKTPEEVWKSADSVRREYRRSIEYSLHSLISYVKKYGNKNTVLVFLGDHQPHPIVTGNHVSRDVPVALVAHDPAVLRRISKWGWSDGLKPGHKAPVWRMDRFRDRFLSAYGSQKGTAPTPPRK